MTDLESQSGRAPLRVVIAGGGVAAIEALIALHTLAQDRVAVVVVSERDEFIYRPLLVGEPFGLAAPRRYGLEELCQSLDAHFIQDRVVGVRPDAHEVQTADGETLAYDVLLMAVGAVTHPAFEFGASFEREHSPEDFDDVLRDLDEGFVPTVAIVVPDGISWPLPAYELAMLTVSWADQHLDGRVQVTLVTPEPAPLSLFGTQASDAVRELLAEEGVEVRCNAVADVVSSTALRVDGTWMDAERIVSLPRLTGPRISGLPCDTHGFLEVDAFGRVQGVDDVYAAGDGTTIEIKQGGLAAQQADVAATHIAERAGADVEAHPLEPVLRGLLVARQGPCFLRAELRDVEATSAFSREALWWPPSKIASRWLAPHLAYLESERPYERSVDVDA